MPATLNNWEATEKGADLAAKFLEGDRQAVADTLRAMEPADAAAVGIFIGGFLTPGKRLTLVDLILEDK